MIWSCEASEVVQVVKFGKKKRSANLALASVATVGVIAATLLGQTVPLAWLCGTTPQREILANFPRDPSDGVGRLNRLPRNRRSIQLLVQLLSSEEGSVVSAASHTLHAWLDELTPSRHYGLGDELARETAVQLDCQSASIQLPLGVTSDLVDRLLRWPFVDEADRPEVAALCMKALQRTAEMKRTAEMECKNSKL